METMNFNVKTISTILRNINTYFMEGQLDYAVRSEGKIYASERFVEHAGNYGVPAEEINKIKESYKPINYMIDFMYENARKIDVLYLIVAPALLEGIAAQIERNIEGTSAKVLNRYSVEVTRIMTQEEKAKTAEAQAHAACETPQKKEMLTKNGTAQYLHVGIPITDKKPNMIYLDEFKVWITNADDYDFKIEYLRYEEGTPFPGILHKNPHIAYMVQDMKPYLEQADQVLYGPQPLTDEIDFAYILLDETIFELQAKK